MSAGGLVNTTGNVTLGGAAAGTGKAVVSGSGSAWNVTGALTVASLGSGTLTVESGGSLTTTGLLSLLDPGGHSERNAQFPGRNDHGKQLPAQPLPPRSIGPTAHSSLTAASSITAAHSSRSTVAKVTTCLRCACRPAQHSTAANLPNLTIGSIRQGAVIVSGGSSFQTTTTSIGTQDGGSGTLLVEGVNSAFSTTGELNVGGTATTGGGIGTVTLGNSGTVTVGDRLRLWNGALINMNGGTLTLQFDRRQRWALQFRVRHGASLDESDCQRRCPQCHSRNDPRAGHRPTARRARQCVEPAVRHHGQRRHARRR